MAKIIPQRDLRNRNAEIMAAVEAGATFVVSRNGTPVAEFRPVTRGRRTFVPRGDIVAAAAAGPWLDADAFKRDVEAVF